MWLTKLFRSSQFLVVYMSSYKSGFVFYIYDWMYSIFTLKICASYNTGVKHFRECLRYKHPDEQYVFQVEPNWRLEHQFVVDVHQSALAADASSRTHPITASVHTPAQISSIFDSISYDKGQ